MPRLSRLLVAELSALLLAVVITRWISIISGLLTRKCCSIARARLSHASRLGDLLPPVDTVVLQINDNERFIASARAGPQVRFWWQTLYSSESGALGQRGVYPVGR